MTPYQMMKTNSFLNVYLQMSALLLLTLQSEVAKVCPLALPHLLVCPHKTNQKLLNTST